MLPRPLAYKIKTAVNGFIDDLVRNKLLLSFASAERSSQVRDCAIITWRGGLGNQRGRGIG